MDLENTREVILLLESMLQYLFLKGCPDLRFSFKSWSGVPELISFTGQLEL